MNQNLFTQSMFAIAVVFICLLTYALHVEDKPFFATSIAGTFLIHMWTRPSRRECVLTATIGVLLAAAYALWWPPAIRSLSSVTLACAAWMGVASLLVNGVQGIRLEGPAREAKKALFAPTFLLAISSIVGAAALVLTSYLHPRTYDLFLYSFDSNLGFQPSFLMGRLFAQQPPFAFVSRTIYAATPLAIALLYALQLTSARRPQINILWVFFGAGFSGLFLYHLFPATGPIFVFGSNFPFSPPLVDRHVLEAIALPSDAPRNAMPSVHTAWVLLVWWNSRTRPAWVRVLAALFLVFTLFATLGLGEHYLIDLVVAVPFSVALQGAFSTGIPIHHPVRRAAWAAGAVVVALWLIALRIPGTVFQGSAMLSWGAITCTIVPFLILEQRLADGWTKAQHSPSRSTQ